jgi:2-polyprenyl-3-methyl-5-hydroxy-6-metoxy-1,4-benzoquinol methylase
LVFQHHIGGPELLSDLYTHWVHEPQDPEAEIDTYRDEIGNIPQSRDAHEIMAAAAFLRLPLKGLKTLDYGMGWALWARIAAHLGCASYGSDLAEPRMEFARRHGVAAIDDEEIGRHKFHFINTEQVFEHVPEPLALLRRLGRSLEPGGIVKISIPSGENADVQIAALNAGTYKGDYASIVPVQPLEHVNCFARHSVAVMAEEAGMEIVRPNLLQSYAFLRYPGTLAVSRPRKTLKELVRPWYQYRNPANIYVWLRHKA